MWHDLLVDGSKTVLGGNPGRGLAYGQNILIKLLKNAGSSHATLRGIFRAHQHHDLAGPMLSALIQNKGVVNLQVIKHGNVNHSEWTVVTC
jgi:hypothetical protein